MSASPDEAVDLSLCDSLVFEYAPRVHHRMSATRITACEDEVHSTTFSAVPIWIYSGRDSMGRHDSTRHLIRSGQRPSRVQEEHIHCLRVSDERRDQWDISRSPVVHPSWGNDLDPRVQRHDQRKSDHGESCLELGAADPWN